jgi:hypothetical protein
MTPETSSGVNWASLSAFEKVALSRGAIPVLLQNSADIVGVPLANLAAVGSVGIGVGAAGYRVVDIWEQIQGLGGNPAGGNCPCTR